MSDRDLTSSIRVLVLDDHPVVTEGLRVLLEREADLEVVGAAITLDEATHSSADPHVVLADLVLGARHGADVVAALRVRFPYAAVLALTMVDDPSEVRAVLAAGARGYLLKEAAAAVLVDAVRRVASGEEYLQPSVGAALARHAESNAPVPASPSLSARELDVARLVALGHTNTEIGTLLAVSTRTVETHRARLMDKLDVRTRAELVRRAVELGLVDLSAP